MLPVPGLQDRCFQRSPSLALCMPAPTPPQIPSTPQYPPSDLLAKSFRTRSYIDHSALNLKKLSPEGSSKPLYMIADGLKAKH